MKIYALIFSQSFQLIKMESDRLLKFASVMKLILVLHREGSIQGREYYLGDFIGVGSRRFAGGGGGFGGGRGGGL